MTSNFDRSVKCISNTPLTEDQISDAIDGIASSEVETHLGMCPYCKQRRMMAEQAEGWIRRGLHPSAEKIGEFQLGMLPDDESAAIRDHIEHCLRCGAEWATLRAFLSGDDLEVEAETATAPAPKQTVRKGVINVTHLKVRTLTEMAPVRAIDTYEVPIMAEGEENPDIKLMATWTKQQNHSTGTLIGQLMPPLLGVAGIQVHCYHEGGMTISEVDNVGQFYCKAIMAGPFRLVIVLPNTDIVVLERGHLPR